MPPEGEMKSRKTGSKICCVMLHVLETLSRCNGATIYTSSCIVTERVLALQSFATHHLCETLDSFSQWLAEIWQLSCWEATGELEVELKFLSAPELARRLIVLYHECEVSAASFNYMYCWWGFNFSRASLNSLNHKFLIFCQGVFSSCFANKWGQYMCNPPTKTKFNHKMKEIAIKP